VRSTTPDPLFRDGYDRIAFLTQLARTTEFVGWRCISACLMTTHYHLLVEVAEDGLSPAMKRLNWSTAMAFNKRHGRRGHWVGGKYFSAAVVSDGQLLTVFRYIARNPVMAGMCERPEDWPWSSYRTTLGLDGGFSFVDASIVLAQFSPAGDAALQQLRGFVETPWD
jgi:REP element-mobilizing transposase RayT